MMKKKAKTIAIMGVDGSGKSTAVELLKNKYGSRCSVIYMGNTRFEDPRIDRLKSRRFSRPLILLLIYRCYWKRYVKGLYQSELAIFDRYVHEIFINAGKGWYNRINAFLYKYCFPKPNIIVYLYCPAEESLRRKSDIPDSDVFVALKKRFDDYFLKNKQILCLNSSQLSPAEITEQISNFINHSLGI